jgi:hypothetical protein
MNELTATQTSSTGNNSRRSKPFPFRPFASISGARSLLPGLGEDEIVSLIEARQLAVAFNLSLGYQNRRREIRILPAALDFYKEHGTQRVMDCDWQRVTSEMLAGYALPWITATDIRSLLNCSSTQTIALSLWANCPSRRAPSAGGGRWAHRA